MWLVLKIGILVLLTWSMMSVFIVWKLSSIRNPSDSEHLEPPIRSAERVRDLAQHLLLSTTASTALPSALLLTKNREKKQDSYGFIRKDGLQKKNFRIPEDKSGDITNELPRDDSVVSLAMINSDADSEKFLRNKEHDFNVFLSDQLALNRSLPDVRHPECKKKEHGIIRSTVSAVICFHNEARSVLLRTITSIINRSPPGLLKEILLIDDASTLDDMGSGLEADLKTYGKKIVLIRLPSREGLIRARIAGARRASGSVLVFMDSHCEVTDGWLEPLLEQVERNRSTVVCPTIDVIQSDTFEYSSSPAVRGGFNWGLHFRWEAVPDAELVDGQAVEAYRSPAMAGGLFAVDREYFAKLGYYDEGMDIWGGENIELSLRIWLCGGTLKISPCSRVGHIFRHRRPYGNDGKGDTQLTNSVRLAHVWLDSYLDKFYEARPEAQNLSPGDLTSRLNLKSDLKCKPFQWFIDEIYPQALSPSVALLESPSISFTGKFRLQHAASGKCLGTQDLVKNDLISLVDCDSGKRPLIYEEKRSRALVLGRKFCLEAMDVPRVGKCSYSGETQGWVYKTGEETTLVMNVSKGLCLGFKEDFVVLLRCNEGDDFVTWKVLSK